MPCLVIVPCGKRKIWDINPNAGPTPAKDTYQGPLFKACRAYAEKLAKTKGCHWIILSAKYGFIDPNFIIPENYNVTFNDPSTNPITIQELRRQVKEKGLDKYTEIIALGGQQYLSRIKQAFPDKEVKAPFEGLPLGIMLKKIKEEVSRDP